jgi:uncharacterized phiE125 gp8 family phage protein
VGLRNVTLAPVRTVAPAMLPVSLEEARAQVGATEFDDDDALLEAYLAIAVDYLDGRAGILGRAMIDQTWRNDFEGFDCKLRLSPGPVSNIASVTYYDGANVQQALSTSIYRLLTDEQGPYVSLKPGQFVWPQTYCREDAVSVTFVAGFGPKGSDVPASIRAAIKLLVGHFYRNREAVDDAGKVTSIPFGVEALIYSHQRPQG